VFFFANTDTEKSADLNVAFPGIKGRPWRWDPETGGRTPYPTGNPQALPISLQPQGSLLLVFQSDDAQPNAPSAAYPQAGEPANLRTVSTLDGPWQASFRPANNGTPFARVLPTLLDLSKQAEDHALSAFAGEVTYTRDFTLPAVGPFVLDLGEVNSVSQLTVNGKDLGMRWYGAHRYDISSALQAGNNSIKITVYTVLANMMKAQKDNPSAKRWSFWFKPIPTGLVGPVVLAQP
jgi:hypothetical protein